MLRTRLSVALGVLLLGVVLSQVTQVSADATGSKSEDEDSGSSSREGGGDGGSCPGCAARPCDPLKCVLPDCFCSGTSIPGGLSPTSVPQMVVLTFQGAVRQEDMSFYKQLFQGRTNSNGCPAAGTWFVSHEYTDYYSVQELSSLRHEIGVNSITSRSPQSWWAGAKVNDWRDEMGGEATILQNLANVSKVEGERAPFLQMGADNQLKAMRKDKIKYEASRVSTQFADKPNFLWPYTYDHRSTQDCVIGPCPTQSHKGIWQVPVLARKDKDGRYCNVLDECNFTTLIDVFQFLHGALSDHYTSNRAPLVLSLSARWVRDPIRLQGTQIFLQYLRGLQDVYLVSARSMIQWVQNPTPFSSINDFEPWQCREPPPYLCPQTEARLCQYDENRRIINEINGVTSPGVKYSTYTCASACPQCYPWVGDSKGKKCK